MESTYYTTDGHSSAKRYIQDGVQDGCRDTKSFTYLDVLTVSCVTNAMKMSASVLLSDTVVTKLLVTVLFQSSYSSP